MKLNAHAQSHCLEYNPKDPPCLVSGMVTGQAAAFDVRVNSSSPVIVSTRESSHNDRVNAVTFYCSKTNMEFFSGSAAGEIFWWDLRNLEAPIDTLLLNPKSIIDGIKNDDKAFGVCEEFFTLKNVFHFILNYRSMHSNTKAQSQINTWSVQRLVSSSFATSDSRHPLTESTLKFSVTMEPFHMFNATHRS